MSETLQELPPPKPIARWLVRLLLATILFFGSEILLWVNPFGRAPLEWSLIIPAYFLLATFLIELMARYKIRDLFGLMSLAGIYGILNGLLINPASAFSDVPTTLITQAMGAHALLGLEMLVMFLALTGGWWLRWILLGGAAVVGLAWGTWVRWTPEFVEVSNTLPSQETMILIGGAVIAVILVILWLASRASTNLTPEGVLLTKREWSILAPLFAILIFIRLLQTVVPTAAVVIIVIILAVNAAIIWFRRETTFPSILVYHLPIRRLRVELIVLAGAILFWTALFAYNIPLLNPDGFNQLSFIVFGFNVYGLSWLPFISMVLGVRAYARQVQARPL